MDSITSATKSARTIKCSKIKLVLFPSAWKHCAHALAWWQVEVMFKDALLQSDTCTWNVTLFPTFLIHLTTLSAAVWRAYIFCRSVTRHFCVNEREKSVFFIIEKKICTWGQKHSWPDRKAHFYTRRKSCCFFFLISHASSHMGKKRISFTCVEVCKSRTHFFPLHLASGWVSGESHTLFWSLELWAGASQVFCVEWRKGPNDRVTTWVLPRTKFCYI